jgi:hypothetical protein
MVPDHAPAELENKNVRVVRLVVPAHESVLLKGFTVESVAVSMREASFKVVPEKGAPEIWEATAGSAMLLHGGVGYLLQNRSDAAAEVLVVELRDSYGFGQINVPHSTFDPVELDPKHFRIALQNEQVRVLRLHAGSREVTESVQFSQGVLISLGDSHTVKILPDGTKSEDHRNAGAVSWEKDGLYSVQNSEEKPVDSLMVEFKRHFCYETQDPDVDRAIRPYTDNMKDKVRERWFKAAPRDARDDRKGLVIVNWKIQKGWHGPRRGHRGDERLRE